MPLTLGELLHPQVITKTISQVSIDKSLLAKEFGFTHDSSGAMKLNGRYASYRIFNKTREPLTGRIPGSGPASVPANPVGERQVAMARFWEKIPLEAEKLSNIAMIDGPSANLDVGGQNYIKQQTDFLGQKANMTDAAITGGFLRGVFYLNQSGDNWNISYSAGTTSVTVDLVLPAGNKDQLNMLAAGNIIDTAWTNPNARIVQHCLSVQDAMIQLTGMPLEVCIVSSVMWGHVVNNTQVRTIGGTVQAPFDSFTWSDNKVDGYKHRGMAKARLKALPWLEWWICDERVALGGGGDPIYTTGTATLTKLVPDTVCVFSALPDTSWCQLFLGGELVAEDYGKKANIKTGLSAWSRWDIEPTTCNIHAIYNAAPVAYRHPWAYATVDGF